MSYRELKNFIDTLSVLGYPRIVSIENFRQPNFALTAEILTWLFERFDVDLESNTLLDNEYDRVLFIKQVVQSAATKMHVKLSARKLYEADGHTVQELLKLLSLLYTNNGKESAQSSQQIEPERVVSDANLSHIVSKMNEFKKIRYLSSEIIQKGANIFDLLNQESEIREERNAILQSPLQLNELESKLRETLRQTQKEIETIHFRIDNVAQDESSLDAKIEKQNEELERHSKRLEQLRSMRPAFQDEYERLETDLIRLYDEYVLKHRCLVYLEDQLEELERIEQEEMQRRDQQIAEQIARSGEWDELDELENGQTELENGMNQLVVEDSDRRPARSARTGRGQPSAKVKVFGSLLDGDKDDESLDDSFNLDENVRDEDENSELDSEDELELMNLTKNESDQVSSTVAVVAEPVDEESTRIKPQLELQRPTRNGIGGDSDDDF